MTNDAEICTTPQRPQHGHAPDYTITATGTSPTVTEMTSSPGQPVMPQKVRSNASPRSATLFFGMKKLSLAVFVVVALGIGLYTAYGLVELLDITTQAEKLENQVDRLNRQIKDLNDQVNKLKTEADRYKDLNGELNGTIGELGETKDGINMTAAELRVISKDLNATNQQLQNQAHGLRVVHDGLQTTTEELAADSDRLTLTNVELASRERDLEALGGRLNDTTQRLAKDSDELATTNAELTTEIGRLEVREQELRETANRFVDANGNLTSTIGLLNEDVDTFNSQLTDLTSQNRALKNTTARLNSLTWVLGNVTADQEADVKSLNESLTNLVDQTARLDEQVDLLVANTDLLRNLDDFNLVNSTGTLAELIHVSENLTYSEAVEAKQSTEQGALDKWQLWDCKYTREFNREEWVKDWTLPITGDDRKEVVEFLEVGSFQQSPITLCLNNTNFWEFFNAMHPAGDLTSKLLINTSLSYLSKAMSYYFPKNGECGVTVEEWRASESQCEELSKKYLWSADGANASCTS